MVDRNAITFTYYSELIGKADGRVGDKLSRLCSDQNLRNGVLKRMGRVQEA